MVAAFGLNESDSVKILVGARISREEEEEKGLFFFFFCVGT